MEPAKCTMFSATLPTSKRTMMRQKTFKPAPADLGGGGVTTVVIIGGVAATEGGVAGGGGVPPVVSGGKLVSINPVPEQYSAQPIAARAVQARDKAFSLTNKFRERKPAGLSKIKIARSDCSDDANH